jgi:hypothetical protein
VDGKDTFVAQKLLIAKLREAQAFAKLIVTSFSIYVLISGGLLKFAVEAHGTPQRIAFILGGMLTSGTYITACVYIFLIRRAFCRDAATLNQSLGQSLIVEQFLVIKYIGTAAGMFSVLAFTGWVCLLFAN